MRIAQMLLTTDGAILFIYGIVSLLFVPSSAGEPYLSSGRILYGILPSALGLASVACAVWLNFGQARRPAGSDPA